jgi:tetratricopeptide (TPR) repeat protein
MAALKPSDGAAHRSVWVGGRNTGIIASGDHAISLQTNQVFNWPEHVPTVGDVPPASGLIGPWPSRFGFVGRARELESLRSLLTSPNRTGCVVVSGLGGVGKSSLVAQSVRVHLASYETCVWIGADSRENLRDGLIRMACTFEPYLSPALPDDLLYTRSLAWLASHRDWMVVLDDVSDPSHVLNVVSQAENGTIAITSRLSTGWQNIGECFRLDALDPEEAAELVKTIAGRSESELRDGTDELCSRLGYLPLALVQAAAYMSQNRRSATYLNQRLALEPGRLPDPHHTDPGRALNEIWRLTFKQLAVDPLAVRLLCVLAWFAPRKIPRELLAHLGTESDRDHALSLLAAYSLVALSTETIDIHPLVQDVVRNSGPDGPNTMYLTGHEARISASSCLQNACHRPDISPPDHPDAWPLYRMLLPHIDALTTRTTVEDDTFDMAYVLDVAGRYLSSQGSHQRALAYLERAVLAHHRLGSRRIDTLTAEHHYALVLSQAGLRLQSIALSEKTLSAFEAWCGRLHPSTLASRGNLALAYQDAGLYKKAIATGEQALADRELAGTVESATLRTRINLALAYRGDGAYKRAISVASEAVSTCTDLLEPTHPDTLAARSALAHAYHDDGQEDLACELHIELLSAYQALYGPDHPVSLLATQHVVLSMLARGEFDEALQMQEAAYETSLLLLGPDHSTTLSSLASLAFAYHRSGDAGRAIELYEHTARLRERVLGSDHPNTLQVRHNLACAYAESGQVERAIQDHLEILGRRTLLLGSHHPDTLTSHHNLGCAYEIAGQADPATMHFETALAGN